MSQGGEERLGRLLLVRSSDGRGAFRAKDAEEGKPAKPAKTTPQLGTEFVSRRDRLDILVESPS